jgi:NAD(P)-dependent dehydrogenase (short-subunit alcohol dehydrogenase family)
MNQGPRGVIDAKEFHMPTDFMFGKDSTTDEVLRNVDLSGKRVFITGVSAGLGVETARAALSHGAHVIAAARDLKKARDACAHFQNLGPGTLDFVELDLASLASARACADRLLERGEPLDIIIANAGVMALPFERTADGFERQFGINHLGHFVLINRLAPLLRSGGRLVMLSSRGHRVSDVDLDDPGFANTPYDPLVSYGRSKTANILFAVEFDRRHKARGIRATALHPGGIRTELTRYITPDVMQQLIDFSVKSAKAAGTSLQGLKTIAQGAATSIWAAFVAPADEVGGRYCEDCHVAEVVNAMADRGVRNYGLDPERAKALWAKSEEMVGEIFTQPDLG